MSNSRYLIITSDDYGYSAERDAGILDCYGDQAITCAVLMVNGHSAHSAVLQAKKTNMPIGLHLNITEGVAISTVPHKTIVDGEGHFLSKLDLRDAQAEGRIDLIEVETEIRAQLSKFRELTGHLPDKVDGHQHAHTIPGISDVFARVLAENGITMSRLPIEEDLEGQPMPCSFPPKEVLQTFVHNSIKVKGAFEKNGVWCPRFAGLWCMSQNMSVSRLQATILQAFKPAPGPKGSSDSGKFKIKLKKSVVDQTARPRPDGDGKTSTKLEADDNSNTGSDVFCELMVHPGKCTGSAGGCGQGPDEFSQSSDREHEMAILMSAEMKDFYSRENILLISFSDLEVIRV